MRRPDLRFTRLHLSRPLEPDKAERVLHQLIAQDVTRPLVFETRATIFGIANLVGATADHQLHAQHLFEALLPGARFSDATERSLLMTVAKLSLAHPLPLSTGETAAVIAAQYAVFSSLKKDEEVAIQVVCSRSYSPAITPSQIPDPTSSLWQMLSSGIPAAPSEVRRRVLEHAAHTRTDVTVRLAVTAASPARRKKLIFQMLNALSGLSAPGVELQLTRDTPDHFQQARTGRGALRLTAGELLPFTIWPLGDEPLPGVGALHPKPLPAPASLSSTESVFATTTAPGDERLVGLRPAARLHHLVVTGSTGAGKSTSVLAPLALSDIEAGRPLILIDPKRQLVDFIVDRAPEEAAGRIVILDAADRHPVGFNPLDIGDRDPDVVADGILAVFMAVFSLDNAPRAEDLLHVGLLSLLHAGRRQGTPYTLLDLPRLLQDEAFRREIVGAIQHERALAGYWAGFETMSAASRIALTAAPLNRLRKFVLRKHVANMLGQAQPALRLRDVFKDGTKAILVPLNDALIGTRAAQLLGSLIVATAWDATLERAGERDPMNSPGFVYVDEVQQYLHLPTSISDALATSRSYGVGWHLAHQHRGQIFRAMLADIDVLARNKIIFAASPDDARDYAKMTPLLDAEDFMALPAHHVYANLVDNGAPAGWFSAATIVPGRPTGHGNKIRRASRGLYGATTSPKPAPMPTLNDAESTSPNAASTTAPPAAPRRPGRKPRSS